MAPTHLYAMPRRHPLPLPARLASLARLRELQLTGATTRELREELQRDVRWAARVAGLEQGDPLGLGAGLAPGAFCGLALAGALLCDLDDGAESDTFESRRRTAQTLVGARLCARLAPRLPRPLGIPTVELFVTVA